MRDKKKNLAATVNLCGRAKDIQWNVSIAVTGAAAVLMIFFLIYGASFPPFIFVLFAMAALLFIGFAIWSPVMGFDCPFCKKRLSTAEPWVCGYCDFTNTPDRGWGFRSMVAGCGRETCHKRPKAYQCHHCDQIIFFDDDFDAQHPATAVGKPRPAVLVQARTEHEPDPEFQKRREEIETEKQKQQWESELLREEIELAELQRKLTEQRKLPDRLKSSEFWEDEDEKMPPRDSVEFVRRREKHTRRWAAEEERIKVDVTLDGKLKDILIDSGRRFLHAKLNAMKPK
jgi:hypothetical protein